MLDAILLAGGLGTRLRSVVPNLPKPMAPVHGRPFLDILMQRLNRTGLIRSVVLAVSYRSEEICAWYDEHRSEYGFQIDYSIEDEPLGTGGGVRQALEQTTGETLLVMNGDSFIDVDFSLLLQQHRERAAVFTMVLRQVDEAGRYGAVTVDGNQRITGFREKDASVGSGYINAGVYLFDRQLLQRLQPGIKLSLEHDLLASCTGDRCFGFITDGDFIDIGTPESYRSVDEFMRGKL